MLCLRRPSPDTIARFHAAQSRLQLTYAATGATKPTGPNPSDHGALPKGCTVDRNRIALGHGAAVFAAAKAALQRWEQFHFAWLNACDPLPPLRAGEVVVIQSRAMGAWWLCACRVIYVIDAAGPVEQYGFAYGTLPDHPESGEERFLIEWNHADDTVQYDILAFSRPNAWTARLGYPIMRRLQLRFQRDSKAQMQRAANGTLAPPP